MGLSVGTVFAEAVLDVAGFRTGVGLLGGLVEEANSHLSRLGDVAVGVALGESFDHLFESIAKIPTEMNKVNVEIERSTLGITAAFDNASKTIPKSYEQAWAEMTKLTEREAGRVETIINHIGDAAADMQRRVQDAATRSSESLEDLQRKQDAAAQTFGRSVEDTTTRSQRASEDFNTRTSHALDQMSRSQEQFDSSFRQSSENRALQIAHTTENIEARFSESTQRIAREQSDAMASYQDGVSKRSADAEARLGDLAAKHAETMQKMAGEEERENTHFTDGQADRADKFAASQRDLITKNEFAMRSIAREAANIATDGIVKANEAAIRLGNTLANLQHENEVAQFKFSQKSEDIALQMLTGSHTREQESQLAQQRITLQSEEALRQTGVGNREQQARRAAETERENIERTQKRAFEALAERADKENVANAEREANIEASYERENRIARRSHEEKLQDLAASIDREQAQYDRTSAETSRRLAEENQRAANEYQRREAALAESLANESANRNRALSEAISNNELQTAHTKENYERQKRDAYDRYQYEVEQATTAYDRILEDSQRRNRRASEDLNTHLDDARIQFERRQEASQNAVDRATEAYRRQLRDMDEVYANAVEKRDEKQSEVLSRLLSANVPVLKMFTEEWANSVNGQQKLYEFMARSQDDSIGKAQDLEKYLEALSLTGVASFDKLYEGTNRLVVGGLDPVKNGLLADIAAFSQLPLIGGDSTRVISALVEGFADGTTQMERRFRSMGVELRTFTETTTDETGRQVHLFDERTGQIIKNSAAAIDIIIQHIHNQSGSIRTAYEDSWGYATNIVQSHVVFMEKEAGEKLYANTKKAIQDFGQFLNGHRDTIKEFTSTVNDALGTMSQGIIEKLHLLGSPNVLAAVGGFLAALGHVKDQITGIIRDILRSVIPQDADPAEGLARFVFGIQNLFEQFSGWLQEHRPDIVNLVTQIVDAIGLAVRGGLSLAGQIIQALQSNTVITAASALLDQLGRVKDLILDTLTKIFAGGDTLDQDTTTKGIGRFIFSIRDAVRGVADYLEQNQPAIIAAISKFSETIGQDLQHALEWVVNNGPAAARAFGGMIAGIADFLIQNPEFPARVVEVAVGINIVGAAFGSIAGVAAVAGLRLSRIASPFIKLGRAAIATGKILYAWAAETGTALDAGIARVAAGVGPWRSLLGVIRQSWLGLLAALTSNGGNIGATIASRLASAVGAVQAVALAFRRLLNLPSGLQRAWSLFTGTVGFVRALFLSLGQTFGRVGAQIAAIAQRVNVSFGPALGRLGVLIADAGAGVGSFAATLAGLGSRFAAAYPSLARFVIPLQRLFGWLAQVGIRIAGFGVDLAQFASAVAPITRVIAGLASRFGFLLLRLPLLAPLIGGLGEAFAAVTAAVVGVGAGLASLPLLPIIAIIAAVIAAVVGLKLAWENNWGDIQGKTYAAVAAIGEFFNELGTHVQEIVMGIGGFFDSLGTHVREIVDGVGQGFSNLGTFVHDSLTGVTTSVGDIAGKIVDYLTPGWNILKTIVTEAGGIILEISTLPAALLGRLFDGIVAFLAPYIIKVVRGFGDSFSAAGEVVHKELDELGGFIGDRFSELGSFVREKWDGLTQIIGGFFDWLGTHAREHWDVFSLGIGASFSAAGEVVHKELDALGGFIGDRFSDLGSLVHGKWDEFSSFVGGIFSGIGTVAHDQLAILVRGFGESFSGVGLVVHKELDELFLWFKGWVGSLLGFMGDRTDDFIKAMAGWLPGAVKAFKHGLDELHGSGLIDDWMENDLQPYLEQQTPKTFASLGTALDEPAEKIMARQQDIIRSLGDKARELGQTILTGFAELPDDADGVMVKLKERMGSVLVDTQMDSVAKTKLIQIAIKEALDKIPEDGDEAAKALRERLLQAGNAYAELDNSAQKALLEDSKKLRAQSVEGIDGMSGDVLNALTKGGGPIDVMGKGSKDTADAWSHAFYDEHGMIKTTQTGMQVILGHIDTYVNGEGGIVATFRAGIEQFTSEEWWQGFNEKLGGQLDTVIAKINEWKPTLVDAIRSAFADAVQAAVEAFGPLPEKINAILHEIHGSGFVKPWADSLSDVMGTGMAAARDNAVQSFSGVSDGVSHELANTTSAAQRGTSDINQIVRGAPSSKNPLVTDQGTLVGSPPIGIPGYGKLPEGVSAHQAATAGNAQGQSFGGGRRATDGGGSSFMTSGGGSGQRGAAGGGFVSRSFDAPPVSSGEAITVKIHEDSVTSFADAMARLPNTVNRAARQFGVDPMAVMPLAQEELARLYGDSSDKNTPIMRRGASSMGGSEGGFDTVSMLRDQLGLSDEATNVLRSGGTVTPAHYSDTVSGAFNRYATPEEQAIEDSSANNTMLGGGVRGSGGGLRSLLGAGDAVGRLLEGFSDNPMQGAGIAAFGTPSDPVWQRENQEIISRSQGPGIFHQPDDRPPVDGNGNPLVMAADGSRWLPAGGTNRFTGRPVQAPGAGAGPSIRGGGGLSGGGLSGGRSFDHKGGVSPWALGGGAGGGAGGGSYFPLGSTRESYDDWAAREASYRDTEPGYQALRDFFRQDDARIVASRGVLDPARERQFGSAVGGDFPPIRSPITEEVRGRTVINNAPMRPLEHWDTLPFTDNPDADRMQFIPEVQFDPSQYETLGPRNAVEQAVEPWTRTILPDLVTHASRATGIGQHAPLHLNNVSSERMAQIREENDAQVAAITAASGQGLSDTPVSEEVRGRMVVNSPLANAPRQTLGDAINDNYNQLSPYGPIQAEREHFVRTGDLPFGLTNIGQIPTAGAPYNVGQGPGGHRFQSGNAAYDAAVNNNPFLDPTNTGSANFTGSLRAGERSSVGRGSIWNRVNDPYDRSYSPFSARDSGVRFTPTGSGLSDALSVPDLSQMVIPAVGNREVVPMDPGGRLDVTPRTTDPNYFPPNTVPFGQPGHINSPREASDARWDPRYHRNEDDIPPWRGGSGLTGPTMGGIAPGTMGPPSPWSGVNTGGIMGDLMGTGGMMGGGGDGASLGSALSGLPTPPSDGGDTMSAALGGMTQQPSVEDTLGATGAGLVDKTGIFIDTAQQSGSNSLGQEASAEDASANLDALNTQIGGSAMFTQRLGRRPPPEQKAASPPVNQTQTLTFDNVVVNEAGVDFVTRMVGYERRLFRGGGKG